LAALLDVPGNHASVQKYLIKEQPSALLYKFADSKQLHTTMVPSELLVNSPDVYLFRNTNSSRLSKSKWAVSGKTAAPACTKETTSTL
jgi:hypothetical protein